MFRKSGHEKRILDSFVCAGYKDGKKDACEVRSISDKFAYEPSDDLTLMTS